MSTSRHLPRLACVAVAVSVALSPIVVAPTAGAATKAKWTVMVYMSGDNNRETSLINDLEKKLGIGSNASVQVVALADRGPGGDTRYGDWTSTKIFHATRGMKARAAQAVADLGQRDLGDPATLTTFVKWTKAHYPADHYALFFWGANAKSTTKRTRPEMWSRARQVLTADGAAAKVLSEVPGSVLSVTAGSREGFKSWAVTVKRVDGTIVVGYVDVESGIVFDWTVMAGPGTPSIDLDGANGALETAEPPAPGTSSVSEIVDDIGQIDVVGYDGCAADTPADDGIDVVSDWEYVIPEYYYDPEYPDYVYEESPECSPASLEVIDMWDAEATEVVELPKDTRSKGLRYDVIVRTLQANPGMTAKQVAFLATRTATATRAR